MIEVTLKFENQQTADSFVTWFQEKGADQFFKAEPTANSLDSEGRTLFLTAQEKPVAKKTSKPAQLDGNDVPNGMKEPVVHGRDTSKEFETFGSVEKSSVTDIREENKQFGKPDTKAIGSEAQESGKANEAKSVSKQVSETKTEAVKGQKEVKK